MNPRNVIVHRRLQLRQRTQWAARRVLPLLALFLASPLAGPVLTSQACTHAPAAVPALRPTAPLPVAARFDQRLRDVYTGLGVEKQGLRYAVFAKAMTGYLNLEQAGQLGRKDRLTVIDFDLPSTAKRLWVLDVARRQVLFNTLVAHGRNSGDLRATAFSNTNESNMSSLGFYVTASEYRGKHGRSLQLRGLDEGFNTNARARAIVVHGADYVSEDFIKQNGRLGRSLGCPALPLDQYAQIIDAVNGGTALFLSASVPGYSSKLLNQEVAEDRLLGGEVHA